MAIKYAIRQKVLTSNPLPKGKDEDAAPKVAEAVDKRSLLNPVQVAALLAWIADRPRTGYRLHAFFATLYYAGLRPEEAVALRVSATTLPAEGWASCSSTPPNPRSAASGPTTATSTRPAISRAAPRGTPVRSPSTPRSSPSSAT